MPVVSDPESEQELAEGHLMLKNDCLCFRMSRSSSFVGNNPSLHLESVEVGYSDIFLEYSIYLTTRSICLEYSDIYLEYVNPFPIPGICLEYA